MDKESKYEISVHTHTKKLKIRCKSKHEIKKKIYLKENWCGDCAPFVVVGFFFFLVAQ